MRLHMVAHTTSPQFKKKKKSVNKSKFIIKRLYSIYKDLYVNIYMWVLDNKVFCGSK